MRIVCILTGPSTHLDHLGVLSAYLSLPLIVTDPRTYALAKTHYPDFDVTLSDLTDLSLDVLRQYDCILHSGQLWAAELKPFLPTTRLIYCPHGHSDKILPAIPQDLTLFYGPQTSGDIRTGNYRLAYYKKHQPFFDRLVQIPLPQDEKPILFYAPTWDSSSFFQATDPLIEELLGSYHLLIKLHPFLMEHHPASVLSFEGRWQKHPSIHILGEFPPIYPLLARSSSYLGDHSSIGYDFLAFDRPLYFFPGPPAPLRRCGTELFTPQHPLDLQNQRHALYTQAFGNERHPQDILSNLLSHI
ncbi:MAG: CDP-glycerol glycerophosphotransferase family protein [Verrucomicrobia bacterium]|nr:CDP-glycerol glycerophosphotransferase family protein [Verrucomicrobiota bacterium]